MATGSYTVRAFGDVWLAWGLWRMLGLDALLDELIEAMEKKYGQLGRVWVMDRGMVSEENLAYL